MQSLQQHLKGAEKDVASLIFKISQMAEPIRSEFTKRRGKADTKNVFGEEQLVLDKWANDFLKGRLNATKMVKMLGSEEEPDVIKLRDGAMFSVTIDPLDGSSNIESNNMVGTIFGIYKDNLPVEGRKQVAAMYLLYGPVITLVYSVGKGVHEFLSTSKGFLLKEENIKLPEKGELYSVGGLRKDWMPNMEKFVQWMEQEGYKLRYGGSFTGDLNQVLQYGGVFAYPALTSKPEGKLRLLFEANPMSFIIEAAGGASSNGKIPILDIEPVSVNQRTPLFIGNKDLVKKAEEFLNL